MRVWVVVAREDGQLDTIWTTRELAEDRADALAERGSPNWEAVERPVFAEPISTISNRRLDQG